jgi:PIN domain nuclease of toxin-antitoxin system
MTDDIGLLAGLLDWPRRDPFDRIIAATAIELNLSLPSADAVFDTLSSLTGRRARVW